MVSNLDEEFRYYRQGGTGLSATLIALSSSLIYWQRKNLFPPSQAASPCVCYVWLQLAILGIVVILSVGIQFVTYLGYKYQANAYQRDT